MKHLLDPRTGRAYPKEFFSVEMVDTLLMLVDAVVPTELIAGWSDEDRKAAGDWALRRHLRASDNLNRVPSMPECVKRDATVFDLVEGQV